MRLAWAFFKRDALIAVSYRVSFVVQMLGNLLLLGIFYYIGKLIGQSTSPALAPYGGNYLAFMLIGLALTDCVGVSLTTFASQIREGQMTGTLEATLMSPVKLPIILIYSCLWNYFLSAFRFTLYLVLGAVFYGISIGKADPLSALVIFVLTVLCFAGVGILWASVIMVLKRGEAILTTVGFIVILVSGVLFPRSVLPVWLQHLAQLIPLTPALEGMRLAVLQGHGLRDLAGTIWKLCAFTLVLLVFGLASFTKAVTIAKKTGSLVEF